MTAVPPRPAAADACRRVELRGAPPENRDWCATHNRQFYDCRAEHTAAPDATAGDGLRERAERIVANWWVNCDPDAAAPLVNMIETALRDVLAAAARDAELRETVTSLAVRFETFGEVLHDVRAAEAYTDAGASLREALDPS